MVLDDLATDDVTDDAADNPSAVNSDNTTDNPSVASQPNNTTENPSAANQPDNTTDNPSPANYVTPLISSPDETSEQLAESLTQFVDEAKASGQKNSVITLDLNLTEVNQEGETVTRELTQEQRAALAYAQLNQVIVVVPAGTTDDEMAVLGQLSQEFDNVVTTGTAKRVNDEVALSKAYAPTENSGSGLALDILADSQSGDTLGSSRTVSDAASEIWAVKPELNYTQVIDIIKRTATDLNQANWDSESGSGLLNPTAAVSLAKATSPEPYTVKPGARTITDNFISQPNPDKELPGDPTHPAIQPAGIPQTNIDTGSNSIANATKLRPSVTVDVIDQVSAIDPTDIYQVDSRYVDGAELSVLSGELSVSYLTASGQVLGKQVLSKGTNFLELPANAPEEVIVKIDRQGQSPATYNLYGFESNHDEPFNINLEFDSPLTAAQKQVMQAAAKNVAALLGKGLPSAVVDGKIIDDLNIKISTADIDGASGTQARTKIDFMRYGSLLPAQSLVQFDAADIAELEKSGQLFDVVQHEFLHALGYGNLWEAKGLVDYAGTPLGSV
jgi:hypothetical protein